MTVLSVSAVTPLRIVALERTGMEGFGGFGSALYTRTRHAYLLLSSSSIEIFMDTPRPPTDETDGTGEGGHRYYPSSVIPGPGARPSSASSPVGLSARRSSVAPLVLNGPPVVACPGPYPATLTVGFTTHMVPASTRHITGDQQYPASIQQPARPPYGPPRDCRRLGSRCNRRRSTANGTAVVGASRRSLMVAC